MESWNIGRLLEWTTAYLKKHGAESPRLDAEILLAEVLDCQRIELYTAFNDEPGEAERGRFRQLVRRRAEGAPVAYLVGRREFFSLPFRVTPDVLIPRPETELLVIRLLDLARARPAADRGQLAVADVCTGSGIIAICAARELKGCHVTATDTSQAALDVAAGNARRHGVADRIEFLRSDLLSAVPEKKFDFVVSNPPYVRSDEMAALPRDVRQFEPREALEAGPRGTEVIERLVGQAAKQLNQGGWLLVEISPQLDLAVRQLVQDDARFELFATVKDLAGRPRVVQARKK